jgi:RimJ/RimL family protein N-acetyltransferase
MRKEAHFRKNLFVDGEWIDECIYAMLHEEWQAR